METISYRGEEEKYYFIGKIDKNEVNSEDLVFTYPLEVYLEDEERVPIDDAECTVTFSDGSKEKAVVKSGRAKFKEAPIGIFKIEVESYEFVFKLPGKIIKARWEKNKAKCGDEIKMLVDLEDFVDGTLAKILVWQRKDSQDIIIAEFDAKVQGNKVEAIWKHSEKDQEELEYYFVVEVEEEDASSGPLVITRELKDFGLWITVDLLSADGSTRLSEEDLGTPAPVSPINTDPTATTEPTGISIGSLHVIAISPCLAAGFPFMKTPVLPTIILP